MPLKFIFNIKLGIGTKWLVAGVIFDKTIELTGFIECVIVILRILFKFPVTAF